MKNQERYKRQIAIPQIGTEGQQRLQDAKVLVVGAGGLGCPVLTYLTCSGVGYIYVIDEDIVSESNLNRQFFYEQEDIGKPKAELAAKRLQRQNPSITVCGEVLRVTKNNVKQFVESVDVVVDCVDNMETRVIMNEACLQADVPLVEAGIQDFYGFITVVDKEHACLECMGFQKNLEKRVTPTVGATAGIIGSMQALECIKIILGILPIATGKLLQYDGIYGTVDTVKIEPSPTCRFHGNNGRGKLKYEVTEITRFRNKELGLEQLQVCNLIENHGMEGDKYAKGGDRQLTLIGSRGKEWMKEQGNGFCFKKCKENLCLADSLVGLKCGDQLQVGTAILEITIDQKDCYPDMCSLHKEGNNSLKCLLKEELRYAKVVSSGTVHIVEQGN